MIAIASSAITSRTIEASITIMAPIRTSRCLLLKEFVGIWLVDFVFDTRKHIIAMHVI